METEHVRSAVKAAMASAAALGLRADDDAVVLQNANRLAVRLLPCDALVRVAPAAHRAGAVLEVEVARRLAATDAPVAALDPRVEPRVYERDGFVLTFWTHYEPVTVGEDVPAAYADALARLHAGLGTIELPAPHFTDRVAEAQRLVDDPIATPELGEADRELLITTLRMLTRGIVGRGTPEQLLHGEPHPGNVLSTASGLLFIDWETCCRGPAAFDLAHLPEAVSAHYPGADQALVRACRVLIAAMVAAWRWDRRDQFPDRRRMGIALLGEVRAAGLSGRIRDDVEWRHPWRAGRAG